MTEKILRIKIESDDFRALKDSGYLLCLAKKVDGYPFNIIWHAYAVFFEMNQFRWTPDYKLFASNAFIPGEVVQESIAAVPVGLGQQSTLDSLGILLPPVSGGPSAAVTMKNDFGSIHPGLKQSATGIDQKVTREPNFLTERAVLRGLTEMVPAELLLIWFEQNVTTGELFDRPPPIQSGSSLVLASKTYAKMVDFSRNDDRTITYQDQKWS